MKKDRKTTLAALALLASAQGSPAFAHAEVDLQTLQLLQEESLSTADFYASYGEPKRPGAKSGGNYSRMGISDGNYSRMGLSSSNYSRMGVSDGNYSRMGLSSGTYSRMGVSGSPHRESVTEGPVPSPVIVFEDHT